MKPDQARMMRAGRYKVTDDSGKALVSRLGLPIEQSRVSAQAAEMRSRQEFLEDVFPTSKQYLSRVHERAGRVGSTREEMYKGA